MPSEATEKIEEICSTPNCGRPLRTRGFCVACYYRNLRHGTIEKIDKPQNWKHILSNIDIETRTADCKECGRVKILSRGNGRWRCYPSTLEKSKTYKAAYRASKKLLLKDFCEICETKEKLCYDHDHSTGKFRGTLCSNCNTGIGLFRDNIDRLKKAIEYLHVNNSCSLQEG